MRYMQTETETRGLQSKPEDDRRTPDTEAAERIPPPKAQEGACPCLGLDLRLWDSWQVS